MPKSNQNYMKPGFGPATSTCLIRDADEVLNYVPTVRVETITVGSTGSPTVLPFVERTFEAEYVSVNNEDFDFLKVKFQNSAPIPINTLFSLVVTDIKNPPSLNPITKFQMKTGD